MFANVYGNLTFAWSRLMFNNKGSVTSRWSAENIEPTCSELCGSVRVLEVLRKNLKTRFEALEWHPTFSYVGCDFCTLSLGFPLMFVSKEWNKFSLWNSWMSFSITLLSQHVKHADSEFIYLKMIYGLLCFTSQNSL